MAAASIFDIRTALICHMLMAAVFGVVLGGMHFTYPNLRGLGLLSLGFLVALPGAVLVALRGEIPYFLSVVVGNTLVHICYLLFYCGTLYFLGRAAQISKYRIVSSSIAIVLTGVALTYYSMIEDRIVPRIVAVSLFISFQCGLVAFDVLKRSAGSFRLQAFGAFMALFALLNLGRAAFTPVYGCSSDLMKASGIQMWSVVGGVVFTTGIGIFFLISVAAELRRAIERQALHDLLTNTLNRAGIQERLVAELECSRRNRRAFCAALIDLDYFKLINDTDGHAAGDEALSSISRMIMTGLRSYDVLGRYGGDEFLLLLPDTAMVDACMVIDRVRESVSLCNMPARIPDEENTSSSVFTISAGVAEFVSGDSVKTLLARADAALYDAKEAGRNCVRYRQAETAAPSPSETTAQKVAVERTEASQSLSV